MKEKIKELKAQVKALKTTATQAKKDAYAAQKIFLEILDQEASKVYRQATAAHIKAVKIWANKETKLKSLVDTLK